MIPLKSIKRFKGVSKKKEFKGTQKCKIKHFAAFRAPHWILFCIGFGVIDFKAGLEWI